MFVGATIPWSEFNLDARWRNRLYGFRSWWERFGGRCKLFSLPAVCMWTLKADLMHVKHLGVDQYFYASVLTLLFFHVLVGSEAEKLRQLMRQLHAQYQACYLRPPSRELPHGGSTCQALWGNLERRVQTIPEAYGIPRANQYSALKLSMFYHGENDWPALRGRAAEIRAIAKPLLGVWLLHMNESTLHKQVKMALQKSIEMESILHATRGYNVLPTGAAGDFKEAALHYVALLASLRGHFGEAQKWFAYTIKFHYLLHLSEHAEYLHPHLGWCYSGEDFMQKVKYMSQAAVKAVAYHRVVTRVLEKYVVGIFHRLENSVAWKRS